MKNNFSFLIIFPVFIICNSCSNDDDSNQTSLVGTWELTTWTIGVPIDLNDDSVASSNLLDEADCTNNDTVVFKTDGTVSFNSTYNPTVNISLIDETSETYLFDIQCDLDGTIGLVATYEQNGDTVTFLNNTAIINGNELTIVYQNAIDIYNEDFTQILTKKDLTLIYSKK